MPSVGVGAQCLGSRVPECLGAGCMVYIQGRGQGSGLGVLGIEKDPECLPSVVQGLCGGCASA